MATKQRKLIGMQFPAAVDNALEMREKAPQQAPTAEEEATLRERALLVRFSIGRWYGTGADEEVLSELRAAKGATGEIGSFTKRLMDRVHLAEINRVTSEARRYHKLMTLPWGESGQRILSVEAYREYKQKMSQYEGQFFAAVESFVGKFLELAQAEKKRLGALWRASDYPTEDGMRAYFRYGLVIEVIADTSDVRLRLSAEHAEEIKRDAEKRLHAEIRQAVGDIYERLSDEVKEIKEKLDDPDARLQRKMFAGLQEIVAILPKLNIAGDPRLTQLGRDLTKELIATDVDAVKDSKTERQSASSKAAKALATIAALKGAK